MASELETVTRQYLEEVQTAEGHRQRCEVLENKITDFEALILLAVKALDVFETDPLEKDDALDTLQLALVEGLRIARKGRWVVKARCEDGTIWWNQGAWENVWWAAQLFNNEDEAKQAKEMILTRPTDFLIGQVGATQI